MNKGVHRSGITRSRAMGALAAAAACLIALAGCAAGDGGAAATDSSAQPAKVAPPVINKEGQLQVCTALGLGAKPLFYLNENQEPSGIEVEIAQALAKKMGLKYQVVSIAFPSLVPALQAHQCDTVMGSLFIKPEREKVVDFVPYMKSGNIFLVRSENKKKITGLDDSVCGLKIVATVGSSAEGFLREQSTQCESDSKPAIDITMIDSAATATKMVSTSQVDARVGSTPDMTYAAQESDGEFDVAGKQFGEVEVGAAVNKGADELKAALAKALDEIKADGTYEKILSSVGLEKVAALD